MVAKERKTQQEISKGLVANPGDKSPDVVESDRIRNELDNGTDPKEQGIESRTDKETKKKRPDAKQALISKDMNSPFPQNL